MTSITNFKDCRNLMDSEHQNLGQIVCKKHCIVILVGSAHVSGQLVHWWGDKDVVRNWLVVNGLLMIVAHQAATSKNTIFQTSGLERLGMTCFRSWFFVVYFVWTCRSCQVDQELPQTGPEPQTTWSSCLLTRCNAGTDDLFVSVFDRVSDVLFHYFTFPASLFSIHIFSFQWIFHATGLDHHSAVIFPFGCGASGCHGSWDSCNTNVCVLVWFHSSLPCKIW